MQSGIPRVWIARGNRTIEIYVDYYGLGIGKLHKTFKPWNSDKARKYAIKYAADNNLSLMENKVSL